MRVKADHPAVADEGLNFVMVGVGLLMVNDLVFDVPPPGALLNTVDTRCSCRSDVSGTYAGCQLGVRYIVSRTV